MEELQHIIKQSKTILEEEKPYHSRMSNAIFAWEIELAERVAQSGTEKGARLALDGGGWKMLSGLLGAEKLYAAQRLENADRVEPWDTAAAGRQSVPHKDYTSASEYLFFSAGDLPHLREKVNHPLLKPEWQRIRSLADEYSPEDMQCIPARMKAWRQLPFDFHTHADACRAEVRLTLPEGEIYVDKFSFKESRTGVTAIANTAFSPVTLLSSDEPETYGNRGRLPAEQVIALRGPAAASSTPVEVRGNADYTLDMFLKQEQWLAEPLTITVECYDVHDTCVQTEEYQWNRLTHIRWDYMFERSCADVMVYLLTGEEAYAKKAVAELRYMLTDMPKTGVLYFMEHNQKPFDDGYGTVHMGRAMAGLCTMYDILRKTPHLMQEAERQEIEQGICLIAYYLGHCGTVNCACGGLVYFPELTDKSPLLLGGNWTTDQFIGLGFFAMTFPCHPLSFVYLENSKEVVRAHLAGLTDPDGVWPESMRYHFAVLQHLILYAVALKRYDGTDFSVHPVFRRMYAYALETQLPQYQFTGNTISHLIFGDDSLGTGSSFWHFNLASMLFRGSDPAFADRLLATWYKAGSAVSFGGLNGWLLPFILTDVDAAPPARVGGLCSQWYAHFGVAVLRSMPETERDTHVTVVCSRNSGAHGHFDLGSFSYFANAVPLSLDPGVECYWDNSLKWYRSSAAHSTVQFDGRNVLDSDGGLGMVYDEDNGICHFAPGEIFDYLVLVMKNPGGPGRQIRHLILHKRSSALIVYDQIEDFCGETVFHLPLCSRETTVCGAQVYAKGHFDTDIKVSVLAPDAPKLEVVRGAIMPGMLPVRYQEYVNLTGRDSEAFLVVVQPVRADIPQVTVSLEDGVLHMDDARLTLYRLSTF